MFSTQLWLWVVALLRCPSCGKGHIFKRVLQRHQTCNHCNEPLGKYEIGDGPAYIAMCIVGTLVTILAVRYELSYHPPTWHHLLIWPVAIVVGSIVCLRHAKAYMLAWEYDLKKRKQL